MIRQAFIIPIKLYQYLISPFLGPHCRFSPTCSQYCLEAIQVFGPWKGLLLGVKRILKCHPFHPGGFDPVNAGSGADSTTNMECH